MRKDVEQERENLAKAKEKWKILPKYSPCPSDLTCWDYTFFINKCHLCHGMPIDASVWQNTAAWDHGEFWVLNRGDSIEGEQIRECPFCHCNLAEGEGERFLEKREFWPN